MKMKPAKPWAIGRGVSFQNQYWSDNNSFQLLSIDYYYACCWLKALNCSLSEDNWFLTVPFKKCIHERTLQRTFYNLGIWTRFLFSTFLLKPFLSPYPYKRCENIFLAVTPLVYLDILHERHWPMSMGQCQETSATDKVSHIFRQAYFVKWRVIYSLLLEYLYW